MNHLTYQYTKNKMQGFSALYNYIQEHWKDIMVSAFDDTCPIQVRRTEFGNEEYEYCYKYKKNVFMYTFHCIPPSPQGATDEECFAHFYSDTKYVLGCMYDRPETFCMIRMEKESERNIIDLLTKEELTEEMFEQLLFVNPNDIVFCTFMISHILGMGIDGMFRCDSNFDSHKALKELKEYFNDTTL